jgi:hypothetical protein
MLEPEETTGAKIDIPFRFKRRPLAIAPDFRKDWKIAVLLLILDISSRGGKSSLKRLHVINWAVRSERHQRQFEETKDADSPLFAFKVRFEPAFSRAVEFAEAQKLISWIEGDRVQLTQTGRTLAETIKRNDEILKPEKDFLTRVGKTVTEPGAVRLLTGEGIA